MGLECGCGDYEWDGESEMYYIPDDFTTMPRKRAVRCKSCKELIRTGDECTVFERLRGASSEIEERIYGEEVQLAPWWHCAKCGEIYMNLHAYGYCVHPDENMPALLKAHWEITGFDPKRAAQAR